MLLKIEVTQEDIDKGERFDIYTCPIALSLRRKFPKAKVSVGITLDGTWCDAVAFDHKIIDFIDNFDKGLIDI